MKTFIYAIHLNSQPKFSLIQFCLLFQNFLQCFSPLIKQPILPQAVQTPGWLSVKRNILSSHNKTDQLAFNRMICVFLLGCLHWVAGIICCMNLKNFLLVPFHVSTVSARSDRYSNFAPSFSQSLLEMLTLRYALAVTQPMFFMLFNKNNRYKCLKIFKMCLWLNQCNGR